VKGEQAMKRLSIALAAIFVVALIALPGAGMAQQVTTTGPAFNIFTGHPTDYAAGASFHFLLGWDRIPPETTDAIGKFSWSLDVDGVQRGPDFHVYGPSPLDPATLARAWVWNFPNGLPAGVHTFVARGFTPCYFAVASLGYAGTCSNPNDVVEAAMFSMTVTFS
jgi:hypothetical protein